MIDYDTLKFVSILNTLAERSKNGFLPIECCTRLNYTEYIFWNKDGEIIIDATFEGKEYWPLKYTPLQIHGITFTLEKDKQGYLLIASDTKNEWREEIVICDGRWYFMPKVKQEKTENVLVFFE